MTRNFRLLGPVLAVAAVSLSACASSSPGATNGTSDSGSSDTSATSDDTQTPSTTSAEGGGGGAGQRPRALISFNSCDDFLGYLKSEALERVGPYGLDSVNERIILEDGAVAAEDAAGPVPTSGAPARDGSYTGTNVQEGGVDEADIVKTDGNRIVTLSDEELVVVDVTSGVPVVAGRLDLGSSYATEMFLVGDRAILLSNDGSWGDVMPVDAEEGSGIVSETDIPWRQAAVITEVDLAGADGPAIVNTVTIEGRYLSARQIGSKIRLAVSSNPTDLPWLYPQNESGEESATEANRRVIEDSTLDDWLPDFAISGAAGDSTGPLLSCESIRHPAEFAGFDTVSVIDIDLDAGMAIPASAVGVLASGDQVYSSLDRFYVASTRWLPADVDPANLSRVSDWGADFQTDIHAFALSDSEPTRYVGSGAVEGSLLNQFSMDESGGYFRVVTTQGSPWAGDNGDDEDTSESILTVLAEEGDQLVPVGRVDGLGRGEALYSARLFDDVGFAVTFRQIDPLYVIDLADPANPRVTGELKIPGVSTYLHPISENRILGIGQDATEEGRTTGLKLSLFDVSDRANPQEISVWSLPEGHSVAEYDHRAFQVVGSTVIVPVQQWDSESGGEAFNGAIVFNVDDAITELGRVTNVATDADAPTSDCRPLDTTVLSEDGREAFTSLGNAYVQICASDAVGGWSTFSCEPIPADELRNFYYEPDSADADIAALGLGDTDRIEFCYPNDEWAQAIQRSVVIDSTLFTVAPRSIASTDLTTMTQTGRTDF